MYKDRSTIVPKFTKIDQKKSEFVNLDELTKSTVQKRLEEDKENVDSQVDQSIPVLEVCRSSKTIKPPQRYSPTLNYLLLTNGGELECYDEVLQDENSWDLTELPVGKKDLHNKWLYRIKNEYDGGKHYKGKLVVQGFQQKKGIDYFKILRMVAVRTYVIHLLGTYVNILCNWLIL